MCLTFTYFKVNHQGQVTDFRFSEILKMLESTPRSSSLYTAGDKKGHTMNGVALSSFFMLMTFRGVARIFFNGYGIISTPGAGLEGANRSQQLVQNCCHVIEPEILVCFMQKNHCLLT